MTDITNREIVLQAEGITKRFPGVLANDNVSLTLHRGEILALLGENGAGKSTLMNIIYGLYHPDEGKIRVKGQPVRFISPREAIRSGIGMVHQHFQLIPVMSVAENIILGEEETIMDQPDVMPPDDTPLAGTLRVVWGALWRLLGPLVAIAIGWLVGRIVLLLTLAISTYMVSGPEFQTFSFERMALDLKADLALKALYPQNPTITTLLLWFPVAIAGLVAAVCIVLGYRYARQTWRGRARVGPKPSRVDSIIDSLIDLFATLSSVVNRGNASKHVREISRKFGLEVDPEAVVEKLPVGLQQRVEIIKALYRHADILILDEPTAVLTPQEGRELFQIMKQLATQGVSIIFITHKLKEVFTVADSIVVMRDGAVVGTTTPAEATESSLAAMMVGREVLLRVEKSPATPDGVVLSVENLNAVDDRGAIALDNVSFEVRVGEVLGIAGVQGNGQTELVEVLTGLRRTKSGRFRVDGQRLDHAGPRAITMIGTGHVPEDRQRYGMVLPFPVADNLVLNQYYNSPFATLPTWRTLPISLAAYIAVFSLVFVAGVWLWTSSLWPSIQAGLSLAERDVRRDAGPFVLAVLLTLGAALIGMVIAHLAAAAVISLLRRVFATPPKKGSGGLTIDEDAVESNAEQLVREYDIRTPSIDTTGGNLSGGNQQKMVVAREFDRKPRLLIAAQPTRGIDVGSIEFIHKQIIKQRDEGAAVLLVSAELDEITALSDRIAVMYKGQIVDTVPASAVTREELGLLMAGIKPEAGVPEVA